MYINQSFFIHGDEEIEAFWFYPDHLGSSNYITNFVGTVSQHMEYFAFGETFVEEHTNSHNSPYKYNGKELDEETGNYYYGARYYNPRTSIWLSVDPLANVDYLMNNEAYLNGEHNGGVFNHFNLNSYGYCYGNPVKYVDPNGKQTVPFPIRGNGDGIVQSFNSIVNDFNDVVNPIVVGSREVVRNVSFGAGVAEGVIGVTIASTAGATAPVLAPVAAVLETVSTVADLTSLIISTTLLEKEEIVNDAINIVLPAVLNRTIVKSVKNAATKEFTNQKMQEAVKSAIDVLSKIVLEPLKKIISLDKQVIVL